MRERKEGTSYPKSSQLPKSASITTERSDWWGIFITEKVVANLNPLLDKVPENTISLQYHQGLYNRASEEISLLVQLEIYS